MKFVTPGQMRRMDERSIHELGIPGEILMDRAGRAVAEMVLEISRGRPFIRRARLIAGHGNNGGDAFVAAGYLSRHGLEAEVWLAAESSRIKGDALLHLDKIRSMGIPVLEMPEEADWIQRAVTCSDENLVVVDGLLGTGMEGTPRGTAAEAINYVNRLGGKNPVVAIDIPSGLNAETGCAEGSAVRADFTVTMAFPKSGFLNESAHERLGSLRVADIGVPAAPGLECGMDEELITETEVRSLFPGRKRDSHKGSFGHVLVVAGSSGLTGAGVLAALSALRSGVGLVTVLTTSSLAPVIASSVPEAMVHGVDETVTGSISQSGFQQWLSKRGPFSSALIGPGMSNCEATFAIVESALSVADWNLVLDADALNVLQGRGEMLKRAACRVVITPHPGEMARLMGIDVGDVQKDRVSVATQAAAKTGALVVLKGAGTVIVAPGGPPRINLTGNPGMACGGTGDVLAGLLAGFLGAGMDVHGSAEAAVYIHGLAGDSAAIRSSAPGMNAGDLVRAMPSVMARAFPVVSGLAEY